MGIGQMELLSGIRISVPFQFKISYFIEYLYFQNLLIICVICPTNSTFVTNHKCLLSQTILVKSQR